MRHLLLASALVLAIAHPATASEPHRLVVRSAAAPRPAFKHQLLPDLAESNTGNAAHWYLRSFAEQRMFFFGKEATEQRERYLTAPLRELTKEPRDYGGSALTQADWAARLDTIDWQVLQRLQSEGLELTQPELTALAVLGKALQARFRIHVASRHFDDCIRDVKTMFGLARHLGECPTVKANLLGITIAGQALQTLEEMMQQPGCPNLYWAFSDLPTPLVDLRKGLQGHRALASKDLQVMVDDTRMSDDDLEKVVERLSGMLAYTRQQHGRPPRSFRAVLAGMAKDSDRVMAARKVLIGAGSPEALAPSFSPRQILLLEARLDYEIRRDEAMKLLTLSPWQMEVPSESEPAKPAGSGLLADLLPPVLEHRLAQARLEQEIAVLRHVEALRMFAAGHAGNLPARLEDISLALPVDPFTGKPFQYELEKGTARLRSGSAKYPEFRIDVTVEIEK
jgi:hypothetical protein